jgi:hypothetical protein
MTETWYAFRAFNSQNIYAYGTEQQAERYADKLNKNRDINVYGAYRLTDDEAAEMELEGNTEAFNLDDVEYDD